MTEAADPDETEPDVASESALGGPRPPVVPKPIDRDGCGYDAKPKGGCNASNILAKIGAEDIAACGECAGKLVATGVAVYTGAGVLAPTIYTAWESFTGFVDCRSCIAAIDRTGVPCLVDRYVAGACEYDPVGAAAYCKYKCSQKSQYGFMQNNNRCACTASSREAQCRLLCHDDEYISSTACKCVKK